MKVDKLKLTNSEMRDVCVVFVFCHVFLINRFDFSNPNSIHLTRDKI